ncbi:hypothetical protein [Gramella sp. AN32]|uniref:Uncharacterized protein n=1 Tax=Christiangramia antarctica TaxID=2058158 RepID=A0ABW5X5M4_9FLAO|nr:hypothetical protein [Gramella sp. AN32]MCM4154856.1 hypothetical protein [Gramella sp. AN32]
MFPFACWARQPYVLESNQDYHLVVSKNGNGNFETVQEAINAIPDFRKEGNKNTYNEWGI